jgi:hypothetical protein
MNGEKAIENLKNKGIVIDGKKIRGKRVLVELAKTKFEGVTREQRKEFIKKAQIANVSKPRSEESRRRKAVHSITPQPAVKFGICWLCRQLAASYRQALPVRTHQQCLNEWLSQNKKTFGKHAGPSRPKGYFPKHEELAASFELCVRHLLHGETLAAIINSQPEISKSPRAAQLRINAFIDRLPTDGRGGKFLSRWSKALRSARVPRLQVDVEGDETTTVTGSPSEAKIWADLVNSLDRNLARRDQLRWLLSKGSQPLYVLAEAMNITPQQANRGLTRYAGKDFICLTPHQKSNRTWAMVKV